MAIIKCKKYRISLDHNSKKTQGLAVGDIVRRQYWDGENLIYSLMLVSEIGVREITEQDEIKRYKYFQGDLLAGDAIKNDELMDFARITNLFDEERLGLLYFTASDSFAPYMDVVDGIGKNASLCWPESVAASSGIPNHQKQYVPFGDVQTKYHATFDNKKRVCEITFNGGGGICQNFETHLQHPQRVIVSYKLRGSKALTGKISLGYQDNSRIDGEESINATTEWQYKYHIISVEWAGRHLRSLKLDFSDSVAQGDQLWISDFNIILQSSVEDFSQGCQSRIGKLDGVVDPVFGQLKGSGSYMRQLYATQGAHIAGTLTAGDEYGFGGTFYAGKISRNLFHNSLAPNWNPELPIDSDTINPVGLGNVYSINGTVSCVAQTKEWSVNHINEKVTYSFWALPMNTGSFTLLLENKVIDSFTIEESDLFKWKRFSVTFRIAESEYKDGFLITYQTAFTAFALRSTSVSINALKVVAPQLELGEHATQYQATDNTLIDSEEYGAWFCRGGIGGTMQNPLLKLNVDGQGTLASRTNSFALKQDGSGHLANENIKWDKDGMVTFGEKVKLDWSNLTPDAQTALNPKSIDIIGSNQISVVYDAETGEAIYTPTSTKLQVVGHGFNLTGKRIEWGYIDLEGNYHILYSSIISSQPEFTVEPPPTGVYWQNDMGCTLKCTVTGEQVTCSDTINIQIVRMAGYGVQITSTQGHFFIDGACKTKLKAIVSYNGNVLSKDEYTARLDYEWKRLINGQEDSTFVAIPLPDDPAVLMVDEFLETSIQYICRIYEK